MRQFAMRLVLSISLGLGISGFGQAANAGKLDLSLARFVVCQNNGAQCEPDISEYEIFMAEYAFGLAPKNLAPAETLGYSGFYIGFEGTLTPRPGGSAARWKKGTAPESEYPDVMFVPAIHIRKGLPWSFELGGTISYLAQSELVALGGEVKWSLFEGYRSSWRGFLPDIAVRGSVVRVLGESDVDMTIVGVDGSLSYAFAIGGMITLTPYAGFQYLWTIVRIEPLVYRDDTNNPPTFHTDWNTTGLSGPNLGRAKVFGGLRFGFEVLAVTAEMGWGIKTNWETDVATGAENVEVSNQFQFSAGVGMDF